MNKIILAILTIFLLSGCTPYNEVNQTINDVANTCLAQILTVGIDEAGFKSCLNSSAVVISEDALTAITGVLEGYTESALKTISNTLTGDAIGRSFNKELVIWNIVNSLK